MIERLSALVHGAWRDEAADRANALVGEIRRLRAEQADGHLLDQACARVEALGPTTRTPHRDEVVAAIRRAGGVDAVGARVLDHASRRVDALFLGATPQLDQVLAAVRGVSDETEQGPAAEAVLDGACTRVEQLLTTRTLRTREILDAVRGPAATGTATAQGQALDQACARVEQLLGTRPVRVPEVVDAIRGPRLRAPSRDLLEQAARRVEALFTTSTPAYTGDGLVHHRVTVVWTALHDAEEILDRAHGDTALLTRRATEHARTTLPPAQAASAVAGLAALDDAGARAERARDVIVHCHAVSETRIETMRNSARLRTALAVVSGVATAGLVLAQIRLGDVAILMLPEAPDGTPVTSPLALLVLTLLFGALGGLVSAIVYAREDLVDSRWFNPAPALVSVKILCGALFGVIGALVVSAQIIAVSYGNLAQALVVALVLGYAQQAATRFLDQYAERITAVPAPAALPTPSGAGPEGTPRTPRRPEDGTPAGFAPTTTTGAHNGAHGL